VNDVPILNKTVDWNIISSDITFTEDTITIFQDSPVKLFVTAYDPADYDKLTFSDNTLLFDIDKDTGEISFTPTYNDVGEYNVTITVDDGYTAGKVEKNVIFTVEHVNYPPETPVIIKPKGGSTFIEGQNIEFIGTCDDQDLDIKDNDELLTFEWTTDDGSSIDVLSLDSEFSTTLKPGTYEIILTVMDKAGEKSKTSIAITVEIDKSKDTDYDGIPDYLDEDDDGDGMPDWWELKYPKYLDPLKSGDADNDPDEDSYTNLKEYLGSDGKVGGDDSTDPTIKASYPKSEGSDDNGAISSIYIIAAIVGVMIVILVLVFLFALKKKRKKVDGEASKDVTQPLSGIQPTTQPTAQPSVQPTAQPPAQPSVQPPASGKEQQQQKPISPTQMSMQTPPQHPYPPIQPRPPRDGH
jgi:hypothetical protein